jgi:hypothetical protein
MFLITGITESMALIRWIWTKAPILVSNGVVIKCRPDN